MLEILDIGINGDGIARLEDGQTVFVPFTMPGDIVHVKIEKGTDNILRGSVASFEVKSENRVPPPCRHFTICGGCALQHLDAPTYESFKKGQILQALEKSGVAPPPVLDSIFIPPFTRRRANFAAVVLKGRAMIGFHERRSATIRDVPDCLLLEEPLRAAMEAFRPFLPRLVDQGKKIDVLIQCVEGQVEIGLTGKIGRSGQTSLDLHETLAECVQSLNLSRLSRRDRDYTPYETLLEAKPFSKTFGDLTVNLSAGAFLQPSLAGEQTLSALVVDAVKYARTIADLFCGNGTFTGPLRAGREMLAVDSAPDAIASLKQAGVDARVRNLFNDPLRDSELKGLEAVILDPPRAGAMAQVRELVHSDVRTIAYVSCNPQSFAKDAAVLLEGGYRFDRLTLVDQFIWSAHTEVVGVFSRG